MEVIVEALTVEGDRWRAPWGWEGEGGKAGDSPNPWYGIFPRAWLDIWWGKDEQSTKVVDQVTNRLMNLSEAAVQGCREVWNEAGKVWGEREHTVRERERAQVTQARQSARREKRKAELLKRTETDEKIRKSFIHSANVKKAIEEATRVAQEVQNRGGWKSGRRDPILDWTHWSLSRLLSWWKERVKARNKESKKQQAKRDKRKGGMGGSRGHSKIEDLWRRMWGVHDEGVRRRRRNAGVLAMGRMNRWVSVCRLPLRRCIARLLSLGRWLISVP